MTTDTLAADPLAQFGARVLADPAMAQTLAEIDEPSRLIDLALGHARRHGIALDAGALRGAIQADPLAIVRWQTRPLLVPRSPPPPWLPIQVSAVGGEPVIDWAYFGSEPLRQSFFEDSIRQAMRRPFNRMFSYRTTLADFLADAGSNAGLAPDGFIFHMSRCGSTLVSQMLAALPQNIAISEAAPIDAIVQLSRLWPALPPEQHAGQLAAMVAAFGRKRSGAERHFFIKLDSWHALALPLFRKAFPDVPWLFLYRDPVEVMVSQSRQPGMQMVPGILPPSVYGIDDSGSVLGDEYAARVLAKVCEAAASGSGLGRALFVNYRDLPDAFWSKILPHFGVSFSAEDCDTMRQAARYDAKAPHFEFTGDISAKQSEASGDMRALADVHLGAVYRRLEELSTRGV
jgi:hypothetical protein